jgi:hypothetical protein
LPKSVKFIYDGKVNLIRNLKEKLFDWFFTGVSFIGTSRGSRRILCQNVRTRIHVKASLQPKFFQGLAKGLSRFFELESFAYILFVFADDDFCWTRKNHGYHQV